ncbi:MAG: RNA polymerase subunit sigma-24 [Chloroflexi bacterium]|nr:MAG: RNA polymerase subunit sigma-24 [Chloroflexota bacterium]
MDDSELIQRSKEGDLDSFNRLVETYQAQVYNLALRMLSDRQAAEDASQDTFLSAWSGIRKFREGSFKAWLLSITANTCRDQLRKRKRNPTSSLEELSCEVEERRSSAESPEDYTLRRELADQIQRALAALPPDQRLAVILRDVQGLSYDEVAQAMRCSLGTVRSRLSRGRSRLHDHLTQSGTFSL